MSLGRWMAIAMLVAASVAATAQENSRTADPADPTATAAPYRYESAFSRYQPMLETEESPAQAWRAANDEMGKLGGHASHLEGTETAAERVAPAHSGQAHHGMDHQNKGK